LSSTINLGLISHAAWVTRANNFVGTINPARFGAAK
jgi:hypothetical protein